MAIRMKIIVLLLCSILVIATGISLVTGATALRFSDEQFSLNAQSQLDRVDELINSFLKTGEQVSIALSTMSERNLPLGSLTNYTQTKERTACLIPQNSTKRKPPYPVAWKAPSP